MKKTKLAASKNKLNKYLVHFQKPELLPNGFEFIEFADFLKKVKKNSCEDILISDLLEYFDYAECSEVLTDIISKLDSKKRLHIQGIDAKFIAHHFATDQMTLEVFNMFTFSFGKKQLLTVSKIKSLLSDNNDIKISSVKFLNSFNYYIECEKQ
jgi:hypothetical protein